MSGWSAGGAAWNGGGAGGADWKEDSAFGAAENVKPDFDVPGDFDQKDTGDFQGGDNNCRNCGNEGHFARDCPEPRKGMACFNCGEEGHTKADCTKPRVFKGPCRICNQEGHPAVECPEKPPDVCKNCQQEGHKTMDCKENRKFDLNDVPDKLPEEAWAILKKASDERDLEDFREGIKIYSKAVPQATFADIEKKMRDENFNIYLIAMEKPTGDVVSLINLQGKLDCKYAVGYYFHPKAQRANLRERWPASAEENLGRLEDAGLPYDRQIPKCNNCEEMGHTARFCKQERSEYERVEVKCVLCSAVGHRARDCTEPRRPEGFACRNCGSPDHKAAECTEPRNADNVECRKCNETGHFAKDCPQAGPPRTCRNCGSEDHIARDCDKPRDVSTVTCRNCDQGESGAYVFFKVGHFSRDCPEKKDWSKVQCNNCGEMGHTVKRCPQSSGENENSNGYQYQATGDSGWGGGDAPAQNNDDASYGNEDAASAPAAAVGGGGGWSSGGGGDW